MKQNASFSARGARMVCIAVWRKLVKDKDIAKFLYDQRIAHEKPIENPDGESLALLELFEEINALQS